MLCAQCGASLAGAEARDFGGQVLCEDCYIEVLSPVRTCDPWAVHLARSLKDSQGGHQLTPRQQRLYELVKRKQDVSFPQAAHLLDLKEEEVRQTFAVLRHMELLKATKKDDLIVMTLF
jgi:hypothetical protein